MRDTLLGALGAVVSFVPKLVLFLIILLIGYFVAKALAKVVDKVLTRVGFDRWIERGGLKRAMANSKYHAAGIVGKIVYYFVLLFVLQLAFGVFGPNPISTLLTGIIAFLPRLFVAIVIIVIASAIAAGARELISNTIGGLSYGRLLGNLAGIFILGLGVIAALNQIGVATTVTTPILITVLSIVAGVIIVGAGGGLIKPMQHRWENWLHRAEQEAPKLQQRAAAAPSAGEQVRQVAQQGYQQARPHNPRAGDIEETSWPSYPAGASASNRFDGDGMGARQGEPRHDQSYDPHRPDEGSY